MGKPSKVGKRGLGFEEVELDDLFSAVEVVLSTYPDEWGLVEKRHGAAYPTKRRSWECLKRKFSAVYRKKGRTGDPSCPPLIAKAVRIHELIKSKLECSDGGGEEGSQSEEEAGRVGKVVEEAHEPPKPPGSILLDIENEKEDVSQCKIIKNQTKN